MHACMQTCVYEVGTGSTISGSVLKQDLIQEQTCTPETKTNSTQPHQKFRKVYPWMRLSVELSTRGGQICGMAL